MDMIAVARRHAAVKLYEYLAPTSEKSGLGIERKIPSSTAVEGNVGRLFSRVPLLIEYIALGTGGLSVLLEDPPPREYAYSLRSQFAKSKAVAIFIDAYLTNGNDLPTTDRHHSGRKTMRDALCYGERYEEKIFKQTERTLYNYYDELEPTSVFHYLMSFQGCREVLRPINPSSPSFARLLLRRARSKDDFSGVCQAHNTVVLELNEKYGFEFKIIDNVPQIESDYARIVRHKHNPKLAEHIAAVIGQTK